MVDKEESLVDRILKEKNPAEQLKLVRELKEKLARFIILGGSKGFDEAVDFFREFGRHGDWEKWRLVFNAWMADSIVNGYGDDEFGEQSPIIARTIQVFEESVIRPVIFGPVVSYEYFHQGV